MELLVFIGIIWIMSIIYDATRDGSSSKPPKHTNLFGQPMYFIYFLKDGRKVFYVGQTNDPDRRLREHIKSASYFGKPVQQYIYHMRRDVNMVVIEQSTNKEKINKLERRYVRKHGRTNVLLR